MGPNFLTTVAGPDHLGASLDEKCLDALESGCVRTQTRSPIRELRTSPVGIVIPGFVWLDISQLSS